MESPIKKARFPNDKLTEYNKLQDRLGFRDLHGGDSKTLQEAVTLANKYLDLKELHEKHMAKTYGGLL